MRKLMKKKVSLLGKEFSVFAIVMVAMIGLSSAALLPWFGIITGMVTVEQGLLVDDQGMDDSASLTDTYTKFTSLEAKRIVSGNHDLTNTAEVNANVDLNSVCSPISEESSCAEAKIEIMGTLELTKKTPDFTVDSPPWAILSDKVQIEYTIVGEKFEAGVTDANNEDDYVLIYYADNEDRFTHPEEAILVEDVIGNLPDVSSDANAEGGAYDYCALEVGSTTVSEYNTCHGAKIWYVPLTAINVDKTLNWARANEFYFESSLIQFNTEGLITVYPTEILDFTIESDFPLMTYPGTYTITTTVDSQ